MDQLFSYLPQLGLSGVFLVMTYILYSNNRADLKTHKTEYHALADKIYTVVQANTETNAKLSESIASLRDLIKQD